jgi:protein O-mannosyl-transferase
MLSKFSFANNHLFVLGAALIVAFGLYWPGLSGGLMFDDFGAFVFNEGVKVASISPDALHRAAWSYSQVGPLGRPLAMLTFALDHVAHGLNPFYLKLENVFIHLVNAVLVWMFTRQAFRLVLQARAANRTDAMDGLALFVSIVWLLSPLAMTSVLYAVQRMTSLSATFTLFGLLGYLHFRVKGFAYRNVLHSVLALGVLGSFTLLSVYTKESGALTLGFAWLLEWILLRPLAPKSTFERWWWRFLLGLPLIAILILVVFLLRNPDWLFQQAPIRNFSPMERFQTELRVLVLYLRQIIFPQTALFGLYHDDFTISRGWLEPLSTLWAAMFHLGLIGIAVLSARSRPALALGIMWFYMGHLLESTFAPLELVHEHRNYLAMWGIVFALSSVFHEASAGFPKVRMPAALLVLLAVSVVTLNRAHTMGDAVLYPVYEARLHPKSSRANYDAAAALVNVLRNNTNRLPELGPQIHAYLDTAERMDKDALAPFLSRMMMAVIEGQPNLEALAEAERRFRNGVPPAYIYMVTFSAMKLAEAGSPAFTFDHLEPLLQSAIENPQLKGASRVAVLSNLAALRFSVRGDIEGAKNYYQEALLIAPDATLTRLNYASVLAAEGQLDEAGRQLKLAREGDSLGYNTQLADEVQQWIGARTQEAEHAVNNHPGEK